MRCKIAHWRLQNVSLPCGAAARDCNEHSHTLLLILIMRCAKHIGQQNVSFSASPCGAAARDCNEHSHTLFTESVKF